MGDYQAARAFQEVLVPIMSDNGDFIADMTLTDNLERHKQQLIETLRAVKSDLPVAQIDIGLQTFNTPKDKPNTLICRDGMLDSMRVACFAFRQGKMLTEAEKMTFVAAILTPYTFRVEPEKRLLSDPQKPTA